MTGGAWRSTRLFRDIRDLIAICLWFLHFGCAFPGGGECRNEADIRRAVKAGTGTIRLAPNVFEISSEIGIPDSAHDLLISGAGARTVLRASDNFRGAAIFTVSNGARIRFANFEIDGNRKALEIRAGLPPYDVSFGKFTPHNGILAENTTGLNISLIRFQYIAGFAVLVSRSKDIDIDRVRVANSGSRNTAGRNNGSGGILLEEGTAGFQVRNCDLANIRGNGIWTHSLYPSPRNANGIITGNHFDLIGRDAIQVGHATHIKVTENSGSRIGFPVSDVDMEGRAIPVAIDTAGNTSHCAYAHNRFEEINGKCIDLDGFHDGEVRGNRCTNREAAGHYPYGNYGIVMNNSNPDMQSERISISDNEIDGALFGGIFVIGSHNRITNNRLRRLNLAHCNEEAAKFGCYYAAGQPGMLRSGIYLGSGAERPAPARENVVQGNSISGYKMRRHCITAAPGVSRPSNRIARNNCNDTSSP